MTVYAATIPTPPGPFSTIADGDGAVLASGWTADAAGLVVLIAPRLRPAELRPRPDLGAVTRAVGAYLGGDLAAVDDVAVLAESGPFIEQAWKVLRAVAPGAPVTYGRLAALAGRPRAVRAAASACARNPAALFVPCHRVVGTGGVLGGFRWGTPVKRWLLDHEAASGG